MSRPRRSTTSALAIAAALAGALAIAPAAASGGNADPKSHRAPATVSAAHAKDNSAQAMPGPRKPGWLESLLGRLVPKPPKNTCPG